MTKGLVMTVAGKVGIKETKEALKFGLMVQETIKAALADGKVDFGDLGLVIPLISSVNVAIEGADQIPDELADLDAGEFDELVEVAKEVIEDLTPDKYEPVVFAALGVAKALLVALKA
jgi:hypothetical protein